MQISSEKEDILIYHTCIFYLSLQLQSKQFTVGYNGAYIAKSFTSQFLLRISGSILYDSSFHQSAISFLATFGRTCLTQTYLVWLSCYSLLSNNSAHIGMRGHIKCRIGCVYSH